MERFTDVVSILLVVIFTLSVSNMWVSGIFVTKDAPFAPSSFECSFLLPGGGLGSDPVALQYSLFAFRRGCAISLGFCFLESLGMEFLRAAPTIFADFPIRMVGMDRSSA